MKLFLEISESNHKVKELIKVHIILPPLDLQHLSDFHFSDEITIIFQIINSSIYSVNSYKALDVILHELTALPVGLPLEKMDDPNSTLFL